MGTTSTWGISYPDPEAIAQPMTQFKSTAESTEAALTKVKTEAEQHATKAAEAAKAAAAEDTTTRITQAKEEARTTATESAKTAASEAVAAAKPQIIQEATEAAKAAAPTPGGASWTDNGNGTVTLNS